MRSAFLLIPTPPKNAEHNAEHNAAHNAEHNAAPNAEHNAAPNADPNANQPYLPAIASVLVSAGQPIRLQPFAGEQLLGMAAHLGGQPA